jgi:hypothetical protein
MYPPDKAGGIGFATLRTYVPGRALGFGTYQAGTSPTGPEDGSWSFVIEPAGDAATRLLIRGRGAPGRSLLGVWFDRSIFEPAHFAMERRMMIGIKQLAEGGSRQRWQNHVHVILWTMMLALFAVAVTRVVIGRAWTRSRALVGATALAFQYQTLRQPSTLQGVGMTFALSWLTFRYRAD